MVEMKTSHFHPYAKRGEVARSDGGAERERGNPLRIRLHPSVARPPSAPLTTADRRLRLQINDIKSQSKIHSRHAVAGL
jgi:hypothetical protein